MLRRHRPGDSTAAATRRRRRSTRVGRFGPRSLTARLLTVMLVPMFGLQLFAYREVHHQQDAADSAGEVRGQVELLQRTAGLIVPLYLEYTATVGLTRAEQLGVDRATLARVVEFDFATVLGDARRELDEGLARLAATDGGVALPSGQLIDRSVSDLIGALARVRAAFDAGEGAVDDEVAAFEGVVALLDEVHQGADTVFPAGATTPALARIGLEVDHLFVALEAATGELHDLAEVGSTPDLAAALIQVVEQSGRFDASVDQLRTLLEPARRTTLDQLLAGDSFSAVSEAVPAFVEKLSRLAISGGSLITDSDATASVVAVLNSSFERLRDLQDYAHAFLDDEVGRVAHIQSAADHARYEAIAVMVAALLVSAVLLFLLVRSILRPLRQLAIQAQQVGSGDLAVVAAKPTGPTDIRVVMRTFNEMVATLRDYDAQVRRLAQGDTEPDHSLPGPLGETLRQSVSHLAAVTHRLHQSEAAANQQARTDALTGLANRTGALEHLAEMALDARTAGIRGAVLFMDLDGFKSINDTEGHAEGDRVLVEIGRRLRDTCPEQLVARIGGDEFIVLVDHADEVDQLIAFARDLIAVVSRPCTVGSGRVYALSASVGIAVVDGHGDPLGWVAQADSAVYHAKERGRSRVEVFDERLARAIEDRAEMALTMRHGLAEGQFSLHLQPMIDVATLSPVGAEALLRWHHPTQGLVLPNEFIPIAERTDVIIDLERWVLTQAVEILRQWRIDPLTAHLRLAVNISGRHIVDGSLAELLDVLCRRAVIDPALLDLEITETHLVADVARAAAVVDDLRGQGIHVAIDDFGTGYSSMGYLHQLTVDTLKIDQVFIAGMPGDRLDRTIVELLLRLGESLNLRVVAEGVDSEEKLLQLRALGCHWAQGYHIARPMPVADATEWLRERVAATAVAH